MNTSSRLRNKHGNFTLVPNEFIEADLSHETFRLYVVLLSYAKGNATDGGDVFPAYDALKDKTRIKHNKTIANALRSLEQLGWLERRKRFGASTIYTLTSPSRGDVMVGAPVSHPVTHSKSPGDVQYVTPSKANNTQLTKPTKQDKKGADAPRAPLDSPKHTDPIEHALSRKEKVEAEGRWRTLLRSATRPGSERACEIAIAFAELTRIEPATPAQAKSALAAAAEIVASGGTVDDMRAAWKVSQDPQKGFMVTDLHSLRGTVSAHIAKQKRSGPQKPKRIGWAENANGESVPVYEVAK